MKNGERGMTIYRHKKRGTTYEIVGRAKMQAATSTGWDQVTMIVYRSLDDDTLWVRPEGEFFDGRFEEVE
jgi:hypothetical protein